MNRHRARAALAGAAILAASLSCDDPVAPPEPTPGTLAVRFVTPHGDDGALLLRITGPDVGAPTAGTGLVAHARVMDGATAVALFGERVAPGVVVRFAVPDVGEAAAYTATLVEVADTLDGIRVSLEGYGLTVER